MIYKYCLTCIVLCLHQTERYLKISINCLSLFLQMASGIYNVNVAHHCLLNVCWREEQLRSDS